MFWFDKYFFNFFIIILTNIFNILYNKYNNYEQENLYFSFKTDLCKLYIVL